MPLQNGKPINWNPYFLEMWLWCFCEKRRSINNSHFGCRESPAI